MNNPFIEEVKKQIDTNFDEFWDEFGEKFITPKSIIKHVFTIGFTDGAEYMRKKVAGKINESM